MINRPNSRYSFIRSCLLRSWLIVLLLTVSAGIGMAADVSDYHTRVATALEHVTQLRDVEETSEELVQPSQPLIAEILRLVPRSESVDIPGSTVETGNGWLHDGLASYKEAADSESRIAHVYAIEERLTALYQQLGHLRDANVAARTKDEDKRKIAEILRRPEYQPAQAKSESLIQRWLREFTDWLAKNFPRVPALSGSPSGAGNLRLGLQVLLFALVIGLIGFLIYKFAPMISYRFGGRGTLDEESRVILGEWVSADISSTDLFSEAEEMAREGNVRGAIRKGYIALLCELSDRKLVRLAGHKTNRDYVTEVKGNNNLLDKVRGLTGSFERNWYGLRSVSIDEWEEFRDRYRETVEKTGNR
ncbi:hypothetical protein BH20ACI2_BH20ACI2_14910 [soil metagenome]